MLFDPISTVAGLLSVGIYFALTFIFPETDGNLNSSSKKIRKLLLPVLLTWILSSIGNLLATLANLFEVGITDMLDWVSIQSYVTQTSLGRLQAIQVVASVALFLINPIIRRIGGAFFAFGIALFGLVAPVFESHSAQAGSHGLAIGTLVIHVIAISIWFGGVSALYFMDRETRSIALPRVSTISTWSLVAIVATGVTSSLLRLGLSSDWFTIYGLLIIIKVVILGSIVVIALKIKKNLAQVHLVGFESALLVITMIIGSLLSRVTPLIDAELPVDPARDLVGVTMPAAPTWQRLFFEYEADALILGALIFVTALYIRGVVALVRRGDRWPVGRTISFAIGISLLDYSTSGGLGLYGIFSFKYHMVAHMVLSMIAPIFIILSAPLTLALRTLPQGRGNEERGIRRWFLSILHSRISSIWTHPITALAIFDGSLFALYFTPLFGDLMSSHFGHLAMNLHFIGAGLLFFYVIVGVDPNPRRTHHLVRMVILLAAMSIHAFFSLALMSSTTLIDGGYYESLQRPWDLDLLADQRTGASLGWAMGEIPIIIAFIATFIQWLRSDAREAKRADRNSERELAEYNEYLRELAERQKDS
ncbi:MAG TPA: cytochrome c oxidase assembly protein [Candidatus Nanopelagicaceae bacterium]